MADAWPKGRDLHFHDARGAAATNYFRANFTIREIAKTMAWSEDRVERLIDRYVRQDEMLEDRVRRLEQSGNRLECDPDLDKFDANLGKIARAKPPKAK